MSDMEVLSQLVNSMVDAAEKLEQAQEENRTEDFNKIRAFILDIQNRIKIELRR